MELMQQPLPTCVALLATYFNNLLGAQLCANYDLYNYITSKSRWQCVRQIPSSTCCLGTPIMEKGRKGKDLQYYPISYGIA